MSRKDPRQYVVTSPEEGLSLEKFLARRLPDASWSHIGKLIRQGRIQVDGVVGWRGQAVRGESRVEIAPREPTPGVAPQANRKIRLQIRHQEPDLIVLAKPAPLAMHPGPGHGTDTLLNALIGSFPELVELGEERGYGLVHRLDRETSGLLVVARSARGYEGLVTAFRERRVEKEYWGLVQGQIASQGEINQEVAGKEALSRYEVLERAGPVSLVKLTPVTGRTHQLRIHLASLGAPLLRDERHGRGADELTARLYLPRLALHARRLVFPHPLGGELMEWEQEPPKDLRRVWKRCQKLWS